VQQGTCFVRINDFGNISLARISDVVDGEYLSGERVIARPSNSGVSVNVSWLM
jgi:hypothetical protein